MHGTLEWLIGRTVSLSRSAVVAVYCHERGLLPVCVCLSACICRIYRRQKKLRCTRIERVQSREVTPVAITYCHPRRHLTACHRRLLLQRRRISDSRRWYSVSCRE
jgi:hypothetical protein